MVALARRTPFELQRLSIRMLPPRDPLQTHSAVTTPGLLVEKRIPTSIALLLGLVPTGRSDLRSRVTDVGAETAAAAAGMDMTTVGLDVDAGTEDAPWEADVGSANTTAVASNDAASSPTVSRLTPLERSRHDENAEIGRSIRNHLARHSHDTEWGTDRGQGT
jgi:hypothetical protein